MDTQGDCGARLREAQGGGSTGSCQRQQQEDARDLMGGQDSINQVYLFFLIFLQFSETVFKNKEPLLARLEKKKIWS